MIGKMGIVLLGWGVVLEERPGVSHLLGGVKSGDPACQATVDALCHRGGLALLGLALVAEILARCFEVPDHIIDIGRIAWVVLSGGAAFRAFGHAALGRSRDGP